MHSGSQDGDDISYNAMYISPCFIEHFTHWYRLLGSPVSIPIRQGDLFPRAEAKSKSFGDHLNTIKYKFVIQPLTIGFFCTDHVKSRGSAGLKATVHDFSADLHQRREVPAEVSFAKKTPMLFHQVEVELHDIDLRVLKQSQISKSSETLTPTTATSEGTSFMDDERSSRSQWVDPNDYVILDPVPLSQENHTRRGTKIEVHPFAFSPLFYYVKQEDEAGTEKREYLRGTHDCIMGKGVGKLQKKKKESFSKKADKD